MSETGLMYLLAQLYVFHDFECEGEITEQSVDAQQSDDAEVTEELVKRTGAIFTNNLAEQSFS